MAGPRQGSKCALACNYCRVKKAKCTGTRPCTACLEHNEECWYPEVQKRARKRKNRDHEIEERIACLEALLQASKGPAETTKDDGLATESGLPLLSMFPRQESQDPKGDSPATAHLPHRRRTSDAPASEYCLSIAPPATVSPGMKQHLGADARQFGNSKTGSPIARPSQAPSQWCNNLPELGYKDIMVTRPPSPPATLADGYDTLERAQEISEVQGPTSYLSICHQPAVDWVSCNIGLPDFGNVAKRLTMDVLRTQKLKKPLNPVRTPEPDFQTAMSWVTAYFEQSLDTCYGGLNRFAFEQRLRDSFRNQPQDACDDVAWYALRNIIYATGCRIALGVGADSATFAEARNKAWGYFENALAIHTELIYAPSGLIAIQALMAMAFFAEGLGSPALEFMLLSNATRLAQSKGLHLESSPSWKLRDEDVTVRSVVWWSLYAYDKHLAYREGRPSAIDDENITCPLPTTVVVGGAMNLEFFLNTIRHAQINSLILGRLASAKAVQKSPEELLTVMQDLDRKLQIWYDGLAPFYKNGLPSIASKLPPHVHPTHVSFLHSSYYASLIAIHSVICPAWDRPEYGASQSLQLSIQRQRSTEIIATAARKLILSAQGHTISPSSPVWLTFYFPLVGLINLFLHVIQYPELPTVHSDISIMDIVVGQFAYLGFVSSSDLSFQFPRKIVSFARQVVKKATETSRAQHMGEEVLQNPAGNDPNYDMDLCPEFPLPEFVTSQDWEFDDLTSIFVDN